MLYRVVGLGTGLFLNPYLKYLKKKLIFMKKQIYNWKGMFKKNIYLQLASTQMLQSF